MKRLIALISALAHDPKILIMDEPFAGNDVFNREDFYKVFDEYNVLKVRLRSLVNGDYAKYFEIDEYMN